MAFEISNFYEKAVIDRVLERFADDQGLSQDEMEDIVCVALNNLPAKYVRHAVDLAFYMDAAERAAIDSKVDAAVTQAREFVQHHSR